MTPETTEELETLTNNVLKAVYRLIERAGDIKENADDKDAEALESISQKADEAADLAEEMFAMIPESASCH